MVLKLIDATEIKAGKIISIDNSPCTVKSINKSKSGKHGASKVRIEAIGILDNKKRVIARPGHERFEVPEINKRRAQVLSIREDKASIMDLENFETMEMKIAEEIKEQIKEKAQVEYWDIEGIKIIKRVF